MPTIEQRLTAVRQRIITTAMACERTPDDIRLLAVSKTRPVADLRCAIACGQRDFGENYLQDALPKIEVLAGEKLCWHFIGPLQANKTRSVAEHFDWVHSVDRLKIARRLSDQRTAGQRPLQICLQVNISREANKSGFSPDEVEEAAQSIATLPHLALRGLMCIPKASSNQRAQRLAFAALRELLHQLQRTHPAIDTLSMGMSGDLEAAIIEGSTLLRIGADIFGPRQPAS